MRKQRDKSAADVQSLINELHKAQEHIHDLEERTRLILDSIHAGILIIDAETHKIVDANPATSSLIGLRKEEIIGNVCHKYICPADIGNCPITDKGQDVDNSERVLLTADGRSIPILKTVTSVMLNDRWHLLESFLEITQLKLLHRELELLATTDPLTGVYNRRHFLDLSKKEITRARRYQLPLSISIIDIDHFKMVNDMYGHAAGDLVLKELVTICKSQLRPYDIFGRIGGEEFGITLVDCDLKKAFPVLERIRNNIEHHVIVTDNMEVSIKISAGLAQLADDTESWESLMNRADQALYRAKNSGRNRIEKALESVSVSG